MVVPARFAYDLHHPVPSLLSFLYVAPSSLSSDNILHISQQSTSILLVIAGLCLFHLHLHPQIFALSSHHLQLVNCQAIQIPTGKTSCKDDHSLTHINKVEKRHLHDHVTIISPLRNTLSSIDLGNTPARSPTQTNSHKDAHSTNSCQHPRDEGHRSSG